LAMVWVAVGICLCLSLLALAGGGRQPEPKTIRVVLLVHEQANALEGLVRTVGRVVGYLAPPGREPRLTVVDLGSADDTGQVLERLSAMYGFLDWRVVPLTEAVRSWPESRREQIYLLDARGQRDVRPLARVVCRRFLGDQLDNSLGTEGTG